MSNECLPTTAHIGPGDADHARPVHRTAPQLPQDEIENGLSHSDATTATFANPPAVGEGPLCAADVRYKDASGKIRPFDHAHVAIIEAAFAKGQRWAELPDGSMLYFDRMIGIRTNRTHFVICRAPHLHPSQPPTASRTSAETQTESPAVPNPSDVEHLTYFEYREGDFVDAAFPAPGSPTPSSLEHMEHMEHMEYFMACPEVAELGVPEEVLNGLGDAIFRRKDDLVMVYLDVLGDVNVRIPKYAGYSPLHLAAQVGAAHIVQTLLERHAAVDFPSGPVDSTALFAACAERHTDVIALLLRWEADVDKKNREGGSPREFLDECLPT